MSAIALHRPMKILVLDPHDEDRRQLCKVLEDNSGNDRYFLYEAGSPEEALSIFRSDHPDLILINVAIEDSRARQVCAEVRGLEGKRHTGIIFLADDDHNLAELSVECLEIGADDFLTKNASPQELMARVKAVLRLKAMTDELRSANHRLQVLSLTDELTGLANMRNFNQKFGEMMRRCRDGRTGLAIIMLDLDRFKSVNDSSNHLVGSYVIAEVGKLLRQRGILGTRDIAARYGGDEFIVACSVIAEKECRQKGEGIRKAVEDHQFEKESTKVHITCSVGVAYVAAGFDGKAEDVVKAADLMLYRSKETGRNKVTAIHLTPEIDLGEHETHSQMAQGMLGIDDENRGKAS